MKLFGRRGTPLVLGLTVIAAGCSVFAPRKLSVEALAVKAAASPDDPATIQVTATNVGRVRVTWGPGSSGCQLHLVVRFDGTDFYAPDSRVCTADLATHVLLPGESRTETIGWRGWAQRGESQESVELLDPGTYELRGSAGQVARSQPVLIELRPDS